MERYELISPHMSIFRKVLSYKSTQLHAASMKLIFKLPYHLQKDEKDLLRVLSRSTELDMNVIEGLVNNYDKIAWEIGYFLDDLDTELQNTLIGDSFDHKLPVRKPGDPDVLVLTSTRPEMIEKAMEIAKLNDAIRNSGGMVPDAIWDNARNNSRPIVNDSIANQ